MIPPFRPLVLSADDTRNIDKVFLNETVKDTPVEGGLPESISYINAPCQRVRRAKAHQAPPVNALVMTNPCATAEELGTATQSTLTFDYLRSQVLRRAAERVCFVLSPGNALL